MGRSRAALLPVVLALATLAGGARPARACDSTACAVAMRQSDGPLAAGGWRLDLSLRQVDQSRRLQGSRGADQVFRPRVDLEAGFQRATHEELRETMSFVFLEVSRGITPSLSLHATLPTFRRTSIESLHYVLPSATAPVIEGHEHAAGAGGAGAVAYAARNSASGLGDLQIGARQTVVARMERELIVGLTVKLPTGASRVAGQDGVVDPMLQPGTGSTDVVGLVQIVELLGDTTLTGTASFQKTTVNRHGYRYGDEGVVAVGASHRMAPRVTAVLQLKLQHVGRHHFDGDPVPSTGLTLLQLVPGARVRVTPGLSAYATLQLPAYTHVNEAQLGPRLTLTAGFVKAF